MEENKEAPVDEKKLTKGQLKKLKEKQKKEKEAAEKAASGDTAEPAKDAGKPKKKLNAAATLALEKKRLIAEAQAAADEEDRKIREEEERIEKERADKLAAENAVSEAAKQVKRDAI